MSLTKRYLRDGKNRIIGSITSGYSDTSSVVRDEHEQIADAVSSEKRKVFPEASQSVLATCSLSVPLDARLGDVVILPTDLNFRLSVLALSWSVQGEHLPRGFRQVVATLVSASCANIMGGSWDDFLGAAFIALPTRVASKIARSQFRLGISLLSMRSDRLSCSSTGNRLLTVSTASAEWQ